MLMYFLILLLFFFSNMTKFQDSFLQTPSWSEVDWAIYLKWETTSRTRVLFGHRAVLQPVQSHSVHNNYSNIWQDSWLVHSIAFHPVKRLGEIWILLKSHAHAKMRNLEDASVFSKSVWLNAMSMGGKKVWISFMTNWEGGVHRAKSGLTTGLMGSCELFQDSFFISLHSKCNLLTQCVWKGLEKSAHLSLPILYISIYLSDSQAGEMTTVLRAGKAPYVV